MRLIINGDDFGITHACNLAIIDCFESGLMKSASLMTNMPWAKEAADWWKKHPEKSVGLHLNLTVGKPLCKNLETLTHPDGTFNKEILKADSSKISKLEIEKECLSQFNRFVELTGRLPDHINSHHGIEAIPYGAEVLQDLAILYHLPIRELTHLRNPESFQYSTTFEIPEKKVSQSLPGEADGIISMFSVEDIDSDKCFELLGHPGYVDADLLELSSLTTGRCIDARIFCSPILKNWVKENGIELISYTDLLSTKRKDCDLYKSSDQ